MVTVSLEAVEWDIIHKSTAHNNSELTIFSVQSNNIYSISIISMKIQLRIRRKKKSIIRKIIVEGDTAMAKSEMSAEVKLTSDLMKAADVKTLKGPQR